MRKTIKLIFGLILVALVVGILPAQHSGMLSQYMFNGLVINPAYAGSQGDLTVNLNYRNQWTGFKGAPISQVASIHSSIKRKPISLGGMVFREQSGLSSDLQVISMAAYKLKLKKGDIQFGLGGGVGISSSQWSEAVIEERGDPLFQQDVGSFLGPYLALEHFIRIVNGMLDTQCLHYLSIPTHHMIK